MPLSDDVVAVIAALLWGNTMIKYLDLSNNAITAAGSRVLALMLRAPGSVLETLLLHGNMLSDDGAMYLAESLALTKLHSQGSSLLGTALVRARQKH
jgi:Ran GTPase-activating protein (RanGAP) involved in mRNA processing and transport